MTAQDALLWFAVGIPVCALLLVLVDRPFALGKGRFVPVRQLKAPRRWSRAARRRAITPSIAGPQVSPRAARVPIPAPSPATVPAHSPRPVRLLEASIRPPRPTRNPWAPGDNLHRALANGAAPSAATVRKRAWSAYATFAEPDTFGPGNVERLERGRPPLRFNPLSASIEPMTVEVDDVGHVRIAWADAAAVIDPFALEGVR